MNDPLVIVGAGECGARAAITLRDLGFDGPLTLIGAEPHDPYERPPLSKGAITAADDPPPHTIRDGATLAGAKIEFVRGVTVAAVDRQTREVVIGDGQRLPYAKLLLATGALPRPLPVPGGAAAMLLRTHGDALALRAALQPGTRVGIAGGGFIGLEVAASAAARGCDVTVIEMLPRLMGRVVPEPVAAVMAARHEAAGVTIRCGVGIDAIDSTDGAHRIALNDGASIDCDVVIAGIGAIPETRLAEAAGLAIDNGIRVDAQLRTSDPDIFAAGDCCSFPHGLYGDRRLRLESWRSACDQAALAARNMLGSEQRYLVVPWFWSDQYELTLQIAGVVVPGATEVVRRRADGVEVRFLVDGNGRLVTASAVGPGSSVAKDIRLSELLIGARASPNPAALADPTINLKALLSAASRTPAP